MRLWSIHPRYLDPPGLVALWRESLLAQAVLRGLTRGYRHHPQLLRFQEQRNPPGAIAAYLHAIAGEAEQRGYAFDRTRIAGRAAKLAIEVTDGQLRLEWQHLMAKLQRRSPGWYETMARLRKPDTHPLFTMVRGGVAGWERAVSEL